MKRSGGNDHLDHKKRDENEDKWWKMKDGTQMRW